MRLATVGTLLAFATACALVGSSDDRLDVKITEVEIQPAPANGALVTFSVTNLGNGSAWLERCGDRVMAAVDYAVGAGWVLYSEDWCLTIYANVPLELEAGTTVSSARRIARSILKPGVYRLRLGFRETPGGDVSWDAVSDGFSVSGIWSQ